MKITKSQLHILFLTCLWCAISLLQQAKLQAAENFPPGWVPVKMLVDTPPWDEIRKTTDHVQLYLPNGNQPVRGVFICYVFHSGDPRELAQLWNFALVTVPYPFEYDLGVNDKRNGRYKLGHPMQDMGLILRYLEHAAKTTKHPELATVPIVGWLGQNGSVLGNDLFQKAPERVLAWSDSFPNRLRQVPDFTKKVPFAFAWEISKAELKAKQRTYKTNDTPLEDLSCRANTYGFEHGIYSKFNFFMAYLDRCIQLRLPKEVPPPGEQVVMKPINRTDGWLGDFDPVSEWNPILPATDPKTAKFKYPVWFPDEYAACMWRTYHSAQPQLKLTAPTVEYSKRDGKWGGPICGLGYNGYLNVKESHTFRVQTSSAFQKVEIYDGNQLLGIANPTSLELGNIRLSPGLRCLYAVGVQENGTRSASRPAFAIVR
ncbi:MAG: hypothetical protein R3B84_00765 [Zavarzinella sp.]